jgi:protein-disulfide isomerase
MSKRQQFKEARKKRQQRNRLMILSAAGIVILLIAVIVVVPQIRAANTPVGTFIQITPNPRPQAQGTSMGNPNAPVKIDVFEDFQCPYCKQFTQTEEPSIVETYVKTGKVYYTFHNWPFLDDNSTTQDSHQSANAVMCAAAQGRFWDYHDMLFTNQAAENSGAFSDKRLVAFAQALGLDMNKFNTCFNQNTYKDQIQQDLNKGTQMGVSGTPTVFVNGKMVGNANTAPTFDLIRQAVEAALAGK